MRALTGRIPRGLQNHKSPEGRRYGAYCRAKIARYGPLPADALPILREAGLATLELERLHQLKEAAKARHRKGDETRLRRQIRSERVQLIFLERRLDELAGSNGHQGPRIEDLMNLPDLGGKE